MSVLPDFPFDYDEYDMPMNARALAGDRVIEVSERYQHEIALKHSILAADHRYYCQASAGTEAMQWEAIEYLLPNMGKHFPEHFTLEVDGDRHRWTNRLLASDTTFTLGDVSTLPPSSACANPACAPLDWLGRQMQEDLLLLDGNDPTTPLVAGLLCFPGSWCLDDKMGKSFLAIHHEVPQFHARIGRGADQVMQRLQAGRPVARSNWNIVASERLNCAPATLPEWVHQRRGITHLNAGERLFLRLEWQTLSRLPATNAVLFTIHTTLQPIGEVVRDTERLRRLTSVVKGIPRVTLEYKNMTFFADALVDYLERCCRRAAGHPATTTRWLQPPGDLPGAAVLNTEDPNGWELYTLPATRVLEGDPRPRICWLRRNAEHESLYLAGIIELAPCRLTRVFLANHTCQVLEGKATLRQDGGAEIVLYAGDMISFRPDTVWHWRIDESFRYTFVITQ